MNPLPHIPAINGLFGAAPGSIVGMSPSVFGGPVKTRVYDSGPSTVNFGIPYTLPFDSFGRPLPGVVQVGGRGYDHGHSSTTPSPPAKTREEIADEARERSAAERIKKEYQEHQEHMARERSAAQRFAAQQLSAAQQPAAQQPLAQQVVSVQNLLVIGSLTRGLEILNRYPWKEVTTVQTPFAHHLLGNPGNPPPMVVCLFNEETIRMLLALIRQIINWNEEFQVTVLGIHWATADHANTLRNLFGEYKEEVKRIRFVLTYDDRLPSSGDLAFLSPARSLLLIKHTDAYAHFSALMSIVENVRSSIGQMSQADIVLPGVFVLDHWNLRHQKLPNGRAW